MLELLHRDPEEPGAVMNAGKGWTLQHGGAKIVIEVALERL
jgi:hypothetical protein